MSHEPDASAPTCPGGEDPCEGCPDRYLDQAACCNIVPVLPRRRPRRLRRDATALELMMHREDMVS